jgi:hypothetical protein
VPESALTETANPDIILACKMPLPLPGEGGQRLDQRPADNGHDAATEISFPSSVASTPLPAASQKTLELAAEMEKQSAKTVTRAAPPPPYKARRSTRIRLWFNTYTQFFILSTSFNFAGLIMAVLGRFPYAEKQAGGLVLGNILTAVLMRNEVFMRILYAVAIYGLRGVWFLSWRWLQECADRTLLVGSPADETSSDLCSTACWRHSLWLCTLWRVVCSVVPHLN